MIFMTQINNFLYLLTILCILEGCDFSQNIGNKNLKDRVIACSAGFSDELQAKLPIYHMPELNKDNSEITAEFKADTKAAFFTYISPQDRLKAYEDYIKCIECNKSHKR